MGLEARCTARWGGRRSQGRAHLDTDRVDFRSADFRVSLSFAELEEVDARNGWLRVRSARGTLELQLGPAADRWFQGIRRPKPLLDKLGVTPESRVVVSGLRDDAFLAQLRARTPDVSTRMRKDVDFVFYEADSRPDLARLERLRGYLRPAGAVWVVSPRGDPRIKDAHVITAARDAGLVDTKVVRFSDTHTALKLVIPLAQR
jgi:hypothetical protein